MPPVPVAAFALAGAIVAFGVLIGLGPRAARPWLLGGLVLAIGFLYDVLGSFTSGIGFPLGYALAAAAPLGVLALVLRYGEEAPASSFGFRWPDRGVGTVLVLTAVLFGVYQLLLWEPGLLLPVTVPAPPTLANFATFLLATPLLALGQEGVFRGYFLTKVAGRSSFRSAQFAAAGLSAWVGFDPFVIGTVSFANLVPILFTTVLFTFTLGLLLGLLYYKTGWSLLAPWLLRSAVTAAALLFPLSIAGISWTTLFVLELVAITAAIVLLFLWEREPRYQARRYLDEPLQARRRTLIARARSRRDIVPFGVVVGVAVVVVLLAGPVGSVASKAPYRVLAIATPSMVPTFRPGTLVLVAAVSSPSQIAVGDIVAYSAPYLSTAGPVVHRVIAISDNGTTPVYTLKGDANPRPDPRPVLFDQIEGKVVGSVPYVGLLILYPQLPIATLLVVVGVVLYRSAPGGNHRVHPRPYFPIHEVAT
jgi:signal peptidase I